MNQILAEAIHSGESNLNLNFYLKKAKTMSKMKNHVNRKMIDMKNRKSYQQEIN